MPKKKYYVVWNGHRPGVYSSWDACRKQVEGVKGARYKGFPDLQTANAAFEMGLEKFKNSSPIELSVAKGSNPPVGSSIAVDAACSGNPGKMEYRGVFTETNTELFHSSFIAKFMIQAPTILANFWLLSMPWPGSSKTSWSCLFIATR